MSQFYRRIDAASSTYGSTLDDTSSHLDLHVDKSASTRGQFCSPIRCNYFFTPTMHRRRHATPYHSDYKPTAEDKHYIIPQKSINQAKYFNLAMHPSRFPLATGKKLLTYVTKKLYTSTHISTQSHGHCGNVSKHGRTRHGT